MCNVEAENCNNKITSNMAQVDVSISKLKVGDLRVVSSILSTVPFYTLKRVDGISMFDEMRELQTGTLTLMTRIYAQTSKSGNFSRTLVNFIVDGQEYVAREEYFLTETDAT